MKLPVFTKHPDRHLTIPWYFIQISCLIFPINPLWGIILIFTAIIIVFKAQYELILSQNINWVFAILGFWLIGTSFLSINRISAVSGLINFIPYFCIFAGLSPLFKSEVILEHFAKLIYFSSITITILGLGQIWLGWQGDIDNILLPGLHLKAMGNPHLRMSSLFYHANFLANYLGIIWSLGLGLTLIEFKKTKSYRKSWKIILFLNVNFFTFIALLLTQSRNGWMMAFMSSLMFSIYLGWRWIILVVGTMGGTILLAAFGNSPIRDWLRMIVPMFIWGRVNDQLYPNRNLESLRITQWKFAWNLTLESPWKGWGLGNFRHLYESQFQIMMGHPHNLLFMLLSEIGIPGTVLLCCLVGYILKQGTMALYQVSFKSEQQRLILFTYLVTFFCIILFHCFDITIFDERINFISWSILAAIYGLTNDHF